MKSRKTAPANSLQFFVLTQKPSLGPFYSKRTTTVKMIAVKQNFDDLHFGNSFSHERLISKQLIMTPRPPPSSRNGSEQRHTNGFRSLRFPLALDKLNFGGECVMLSMYTGLNSCRTDLVCGGHRRSLLSSLLRTRRLLARPRYSSTQRRKTSPRQVVNRALACRFRDWL